MLHPEQLGENVVVIGGGEVGVEAGMNLAGKGHNVTVLEMRKELAMDTTMIHYRSMFQQAWEAIPTFKGICNATVTGITAAGVTYRDEAGEEHLIPAQSVVVSAGMKAKQQEALSFYGSAKRFYYIGDCKQTATVQQAMRSAFAAASQI
jgi:NADPH-dependent 2,4-dienoyl-CoA reductase/sulfur reductase-like enzyme